MDDGQTAAKESRKATAASSSRTQILVVAAIALAAAGGGWLLLGKTTPPVGKAASADAGRAGYPAYAQAPGAEAVYTLNCTSDSTIDLSPTGFQADAGSTEGLPSLQRLGTRIEGRLVTTIVEATKEKSIVFFRVEDAHVSITANGAVAGTDAADAERALEKGFLVHRSRTGQVLGLQVPESTPVARSFVRTLAGWMQITLGENGAEEWSVKEKDRAGNILVTYNAISDPTVSPSIFPIRKVKRRGGQALGSGMREGDTTTVVEIDFDLPAGIPRVIAGQERVDAAEGQIANGSFAFNAELRKTRTVDASDHKALTARVDPLRSLPLTELDEPEQSLADKVSIETQRLGKATLPELFEKLKDDTKARDSKVFFQLRAYAILHPEDAARIAEPLRTMDPKKVMVEIIVGALAGAGSPEAQRAIVDAIRERRGNERAETLFITILGTTPHPTKDTVEAILARRDTSDNVDVVNASALALGFMASSLAVEAPELATRIVENELAHISREEGDLPKLRSALSGLGNAASVRAMPDLIRLSRSSVEEVRARSTWALRGIKHPEAETRILEVVGTDGSRIARHEAVQALRFRDVNGDIFEVLKKRVVDDPMPGVRVELLRLLWQKYGSAESLQILIDRSQHDPDEQVRKTALGLIESSSVEQKKNAGDGGSKE